MAFFFPRMPVLPGTPVAESAGSMKEVAGGQAEAAVLNTRTTIETLDHAGDEVVECAICLMEIEEEEEKEDEEGLSCAHTNFHRHCLMSWFRKCEQKG